MNTVTPSSSKGAFSTDESEWEIIRPSDHSNAMITFVKQILMEEMEEEEFESNAYMLHDSQALQATEKSLYDVLINKSPENRNNQIGASSSDVGTFVKSNWDQETALGSLLISSTGVQNTFPFTTSESQLFCSSKSLGSKKSYSESDGRKEMDCFLNYAKEKGRHRGEDGDHIEERSNKMLANNIGGFEPLELFEKVLLVSDLSLPPSEGKAEAQKQMPQNGKPRRGRPKGSEKQGMVKEVGDIRTLVDLRPLLFDCAKAVASYDSRKANDLLTFIRLHSSPHGDSMERVAHYFANALEARLVGIGITSYKGFFPKKIPATDIMKAYQTYMMACPFRRMSHLLANKTIEKLVVGAESLHIIDFGTYYGYQWPCLIQALSKRPGGPPKIRITGIDFPQAGFRPAERVEETGNRLRKYCERIGVPLEYNAIAQKWETIKVEHLKIKKNEILVAHSMHMLNYVSDETTTTATEKSARDVVLKLIRKINPNVFIHGINNGTYNAPFFATRFREVLFHFSAMFDIFEATMPRDDKHRILFEQEVFGKNAMNSIACEGIERIDRPETYRQWQERNTRVGFRQIPFDQQLVKYVKKRVETDYNKEFSLDEDGKWMLQGWKGRVIHGLSLWQPEHK